MKNRSVWYSVGTHCKWGISKYKKVYTFRKLVKKMLTIVSLRGRARVSEKNHGIQNAFKSKNQQQYLSYTNEKIEVYRDKG